MSKTITRKYIQRITKREGNTSIRQSSGGGGGGGGASQYWVEENYISKLFFNQLFTVYDEDGNVVEPNDTESVIASIKSMFGFWTDAYLSALGNGEGGGAELTLASLADVDVHGVANGQALVYDAYTQKWVPGQAGLDPTSLWQELGSLGTEQISSTHLTTALSTYNPTNNFKTINGYSIIGTGDINVGGGGGSYLPLSGGTVTGDLNVNGLTCLRSGYFNNTNPSLGTMNGTTKLCATGQNGELYSFGLYEWVDTYHGAGKIQAGYHNGYTQPLGLSLQPLGGKVAINLTGDPQSYGFNLTVGGSVGCGTFYVDSFDANKGFCFNQQNLLISHSNNRVTFGTKGQTTAVGINAGSLLVSNGWADYTKVPTNGIYSKGIISCHTYIEAQSGYFFQNAPSLGSLGYNTCKIYASDSNGDIYLFGMFAWIDAYSGNSCIQSGYQNGNRIPLPLSLQPLGGNVGIGLGISTASYTLHVAGVAYASTGFYSGGYVTALSDARHKDVKGDVGLTVSEVANAPAVKFLWKDRRQEGLQVGSIAQYWQKVMPEAIVKNADGELTMSYGVIALLASIATARKVEDHERRIRELEEENKKLKQQLNAA